MSRRGGARKSGEGGRGGGGGVSNKVSFVHFIRRMLGFQNVWRDLTKSCL